MADKLLSLVAIATANQVHCISTMTNFACFVPSRVVKEEVVDDDVVLPSTSRRIVAWVSTQSSIDLCYTHDHH